MGARGLPLTLALSPPAGRGDVPHSGAGLDAGPSARLRGEGGGGRMRGGSVVVRANAGMTLQTASYRRPLIAITTRSR